MKPFKFAKPCISPNKKKKKLNMVISLQKYLVKRYTNLRLWPVSVHRVNTKFYEINPATVGNGC